MSDEMTDLRPAVAQAIAELDAEHWPMPELKGRGGCGRCWPNTGSWPCVTRQVADDLRAALEEGGGHHRIGWMHPSFSGTVIMSDEHKATLEQRAPTDPTYATRFVAVYIAREEATDA